jgi:UDP-N-acetylglucosamine 2-epimerase (non-hydrolysing)
MKNFFNIILAIGTRPEAIKMAPVYRALKETPGLEPKIFLTGQHREQLDQALELFDVTADLNLNVMEERQTLPELASRIMPSTARALRDMQTDYVLVHGDTLTTFAVAWTAFLEGIPVGHVEAGLRSHDLYNPFPEEANRRLTDTLTDLAFAPTALARRNLLAEGKSKDRIFVTGQTGIDAIHYASSKCELPDEVRTVKGELVTVTLHRRENWPFLHELAKKLACLAEEYPTKTFVFPVHLNPVVREAVMPVLEKVKNFRLLEPLGYGKMAALLNQSTLVITDSGGLQEEGAALGVPVAVVRDVTERPEGVDAGILTLVGSDPEKAYVRLKSLLSEEAELKKMSSAQNPYGDGCASVRITKAIAWRFDLAHKPKEWDADTRV